MVMIKMRKAVMYGAGNIGRGFIGKVFAQSGYEVCFLDIDPVIIRAFNEKKVYSVHVVANDTDYYETIENVYAVDADSDQAIEEIASCDIMATAVGVNILPQIVPNLTCGIRKRMHDHNRPLNILLAENQIHANQMVREWIYQELTQEEQDWTEENLGLVEVSIGRMVPPLAPEERLADPLLIAVEPYCELPADRVGFKGGIPKLTGLVPFTPFDFYIKRKLYLHNMGHAICAYLGWQKGHVYIAQAIEDIRIFDVVNKAMQHVVQALHKEYPQIPLEEIEANKEELLLRFRNKALKDTVIRVAADPIRKLRGNDRLVGAAIYCLSQGIEPNSIVTGIISAFNYINPQDSNSMDIQRSLVEFGIKQTLKIVSGMEEDTALGRMIVNGWYSIKE